MAAYLILSLVLLVGQVQCQFGPDNQPPPRDQTAEACYGKAADIFFILDSSTSIYINDYRQVLQFVNDVVSRLDISQRATRVGVLTFSDDISRPPLELNRSQDKRGLTQSITETNLPYRTGITNTDLAIRYVRENNLFRDNVVKVIVLVTDGVSRSPGSTRREANLAREEGFYVYVIGVGQYLDEREWQDVASDPDDSFVFNLTNFQLLNQVTYTLPNRICVLPPLEVSRRCNIERNADVFFAAAPAANTDAVSVINRLVELTTDRSNQLRASYFLNICNNAENIPLRSFDAYCDRNRPVNQGSFTQLLGRLRAATIQSPSSRKLAVIFVDDESLRYNSNSLVSEALNIRQQGDVEIIVVGLGTWVYRNVLESVATNSQNIITFAPGSVGGQRQALNTLLQRTCTFINSADNILTINPNRR